MSTDQTHSPASTERPTAVLAFSGGLDTTYCAAWLKEKGTHEIHAVTIQTGGFSADELKVIEERAMRAGADRFVLLDETRRYYERILRYLLYGNVLKNSTYPLSVSAERMAQATALADYVSRTGASTVVHGSTGAGNDQIRFDMTLQILLPGIVIVTPIRDQALSREQEVAWLAARGIAFPAKKATYSINQGLWGTSVGGAETLTSSKALPEEAWPTPITKQGSERITIGFERGEPVWLSGAAFAAGGAKVRFTHPVELIQSLQAVAAPYGIGRDIHVGDTILGIKGRVGFEAAAPMVLIKAHHLLEKHVLNKHQLQWKQHLGDFYGNHLHEGHYLDPVMRNIEAFLADSQKYVTGEVHLTLHPHRFELEGIDSPHDLMSSDFGVYGEANKAWTAEDAKGFTRIYGNATSLHYRVNGATNPYSEDT